MNVHVTPAYEVVPLDREVGVDTLRRMFPDGAADDLNFVLFSTSGTHGSYLTIEDVAASIATPDPGDLTVLVIQPRTVRMLYGNLKVRADDLPFLRKLRSSSCDVLRGYSADDHPA